MRHLAPQHPVGSVQGEENIVLKLSQRSHAHRHRQPANCRHAAKEDRIGPSEARPRGHPGLGWLGSLTAKVRIRYRLTLDGKAVAMQDGNG